jgi:hypothetical protein
VKVATQTDDLSQYRTTVKRSFTCCVSDFGSVK